MANGQLLFLVLVSNICWLVKGDECGNETVVWSDDKDWISLNNTGYCFVNECTIRIEESNVLLNIITKLQIGL